MLVPLLVLSGLTGATPTARPLPATVDAAVTTRLAQEHTADVFVMLRAKATLSGPAAGRTHGEQVARGRQALITTAENTQAGVRTALARRKVAYEPYWIVNTVLVRSASAEVIRELAGRADVRRVRLAGERHIPTPITGVSADAAVDWNLDRIRAPQTWAQFGVSGEGVVVASIDTGVDFTHPAVTRQYRGNLGGAFNHNYNWFDPSHICPSPVPCDNNGHGTHVTGTMTGDDGAGTVIGVAPGAKWISAKGCESDSCSDVALIRSGQWVMAPTDLSGNNPRPDLAPNIVNNSWGGGPGDDFYQDIINAWTSVGIFPAFAAGNSGPGCGTAGSPGDYQNSYAVGAFDSSNSIAPFSSRGASVFDGEIKPNIAAPGSGIRSSVPGGRYESWSGTSMATPHVAGVVALMWSAAPALRGDVGLTRNLLDQSAIDTADTSCGGTIADNNVWGEGRLDAYAAVERSPRGPTGVLSGVVTDAVTGLPLGGVSVNVGSGSSSRYGVATAADGTYRMVLSVGAYQMTYAKFAFLTAQRTVQVTTGTTVVVNVALGQAPRHAVTGVVRDVGGGPVHGVTVRLDGTPIPSVVTGVDGAYHFTGVPDGAYDVSVTDGGCTAATLQRVVVDGDEVTDLAVPPRPDVSGYTCQATASEWVPGTDLLALTGDQALTTIATPFPFPLYGRTYTTVTVTTNGFLTFDRAVYSSTNRPIPSTAYPNAGLYPFWDDLVVDSAAGIYTTVVGTAPNRRFVVEWRNATFYGLPGRVTFEAVLSENGRVQFGYQSLSAETQAHGASASIGVEDSTGTVGLQYAYNEVALEPGATLVFRPPATVTGTVTDAEDGHALSGVTVSAYRAGEFVATKTTDDTGKYAVALPAGAYSLTYTLPGYLMGSADVTLTAEGEVAVRNLAMSGSGKTISGIVRDDRGNPASGQRVRLFTGLAEFTATTDDTGAYRMTNVPLGSYNVSVGSPCVFGSASTMTVDGDESADFAVTTRYDDFGYQCRPVNAAYVDATGVLPLTADEATTGVTLPFPFRLYGTAYTSAYVSTNGFLSFTGNDVGEISDSFPTPGTPNAAIYALWQDLMIDGAGSVRTAVTGQAPNRRFVVEWRNALVEFTLDRVSMEIVLGEDGTVEIRVRDSLGSYRARLGIENATGTVGYRYDDTFYPIRDGLAVRFTPPGQVQGAVTDADDGTAVADAIVRGLRNGSKVKEVHADATGHYVLPLQPGDYTVEVVKGTSTTSRTVTVPGVGTTVIADLALPVNTITGRITDATGVPLAGVNTKIRANGLTVETTTAADGSYRLDGVGDGTHTLLLAAYGDGCLRSRTTDVVITADQVIDTTMTRYADGYGYTCRTEASVWETGETVLALTGDDSVATVPLPFTFSFYGTQYSSVYVSTNGFVSFTDAVPAPVMSWLPSTGTPNAAVYALWGDFVVDGSASVRTSVAGSGTNRRLIIEWRNVQDKWTSQRNTFSVTLYENGQVATGYQTVATYPANVGIEDATGSRFLQYVNDFNGAYARPGITVRFVPPTT
ncbi:subtilisin family serine protease [Hamadaea flava]|uniref:Carboxypeptidase regulatory-like domain-containing protein n=1 Tax=Hamadaea flava TaxID=1742688 RepID=A0ABV8LS48_9ACTN|nr:carboxypeptidase regulatory-like domain-containing protein [Hamadaea flava]MCP2328374.1 subtilisin family serine protease [Hamadaea flava]